MAGDDLESSLPLPQPHPRKLPCSPSAGDDAAAPVVAETLAPAPVPFPTADDEREEGEILEEEEGEIRSDAGGGLSAEVADTYPASNLVIRPCGSMSGEDYRMTEGSSVMNGRDVSDGENVDSWTSTRNDEELGSVSDGESRRRRKISHSRESEKERRLMESGMNDLKLGARSRSPVSEESLKLTKEKRHSDEVRGLERNSEGIEKRGTK